MRTLAAVAALCLTLLAPTAATAERAAAISGDASLVTFDTLSPGTAAIKPITGLQTTSERVVALDTRPATGELDAITIPIGIVANALIRTYKVDANSGAATFIGSIPGTVAGAGDRPTGADFQPVVDRLRVVQSNDTNFRINPANGTLAASDTALSYTAPATGPVTGVAYDRNVPGGTKTTLYGIDVGSARLVVQGGIDGAGPGGPNGGQVTAIGLLGITPMNGSDAGFDISSSGTAFAAISTSATETGLYTIDLATGAATLVGHLPAAIGGLTILPADNCPTVDGDNQADTDGDGLGDACDPDIDGDGISNSAEAAMGTNPNSGDTDGDGKADGADACPTLAAATANGCPDIPVVTPPDKTAPTLAVTKLAKKLKFSKFLKGVTLHAKPSESSSLLAELVVKAKSAKVSKAGDLVLASKSLGLSSSDRSLKLKPNRKLVSGRKKFTVTVRITATDAAGNRSTTSKKVSITR